MTASPAPFHGVLCIDKPQDFTSFDVVAKLRGITRTRKIGHTGTLDPMATGVLPVLLGHATKACDLLPSQDKCYRLSFQLGVTTDTQDVWGTVQSQDDTPVSLSQLEEVLPQFRGEIMQLPPMYSALSVNGQRLYDLARKGIEVERQPRPVTIYRLELLSYDPKTRTGEAEVACSKGTYIRTLCHDLGKALGTGGIMTALRRTEAAGFTLADCLTLEKVAQLMEEGRLSEALRPVERIFAPLPALRLNPIQTRMFLNGVRLDLNRIPGQHPTGRCRVLDADGIFLGLGDCDPNTRELRVKKFFLERS